MWPNYSVRCRKDVDDLLKAGGSLSAYRANPQVGVEPSKDSWAWRVERDIEKRFKVKHAIAVNSGTAALHCILSALKLKPGDEVITTPYSFSATVSAILMAGGTPRFADVDPYTFCITPETVRHAFTKRTRALMPVHLFGGMADLRGLKAFGVPVVEDAAQAVGARDSGGYSGTQGYGGGYSANGGKNCPAGEFGIAVTQSDEVAEAARYLMNHGENFGQGIGYNYRPNELTACVAWHGLQELEERNQKRRDLVKRMDLSHPAGSACVAPGWRGGKDHSFYVAPVLFRHPRLSREQYCKRLEAEGIQVGRGYITPTLNRYKAFRKYQRTPLPVVEELSKKTLCILSTLTPDKTLSYADHVAECMRKALR